MQKAHTNKPKGTSLHRRRKEEVKTSDPVQETKRAPPFIQPRCTRRSREPHVSLLTLLFLGPLRNTHVRTLLFSFQENALTRVRTRQPIRGEGVFFRSLLTEILPWNFSLFTEDRRDHGEEKEEQDGYNAPLFRVVEGRISSLPTNLGLRKWPPCSPLSPPSLGACARTAALASPSPCLSFRCLSACACLVCLRRSISRRVRVD